jgi:energy-coupling factor transporter transmembrane protein EcfT
MLRNLTLNSVIWIILGIGFFLGGAYLTFKWRSYGIMLLGMPIGIFLVGIAMILCGITNGFTDHSPLGRKLKKIGAFLFIVGIPPIGYVAYYYF